MEEISENESWKTWFRHNGPKLLLCARQWTASLSDAEDVVQDAFIRFWRRQRGLPGEPLALLLVSIRRAAFDSGRQRSRRAARERRAQAVEGGEASFLEPTVDRDERRLEIESALRRLSADHREVLSLKIWGELTFSQIGDQLGIPSNTAASRYRYALEGLRRELTADRRHG
ncbi:MAG TPA: sigma-70 family RNA polymerase sigma factor [Opitutaceae bacterium]|jgi:RNA polymerase sigma-70 factor (ECF subfamily)